MILFILMKLRIYLLNSIFKCENITFGIKALSSAKERKKFFVLFAAFFKGKKGAMHFKFNYETF
jgi:hypothetical protein